MNGFLRPKADMLAKQYARLLVLYSRPIKIIIKISYLRGSIRVLNAQARSSGKARVLSNTC